MTDYEIAEARERVLKERVRFLARRAREVAEQLAYHRRWSAEYESQASHLDVELGMVRAEMETFYEEQAGGPGMPRSQDDYNGPSEPR